MTTNTTSGAAALSKTLATGADLNAATFADFIKRLRYHVRGEGVHDHATADALFIVQARKIVFGIDRDYTDKTAVAIEESMYFSPREYWDACSERRRQELDKMAAGMNDKPFLEIDAGDQWDLLADLDGHTVSGWDEQWEYVNAHFTKEGAEAFIRRKKHDYPEGLRVYVDAQSYCWEFNAIAKGLLDGRIIFGNVAAVDVLAERRRQVEQEGYELEHDDEHPCGEIAAYAAFFAMPPAARDWPATETGYGATFGEAMVPEGWAPPKVGDRRRELVKAGALVLAEIERLDRAAAAETKARECAA